MLVVALRQQDVRAEEERPAPELREALALDPLVPDVLRRRRVGNGRDDLVERDLHAACAPGVDRYRLRRGVEVAGGAIPLLALAPVHRQLHGVAVRAVERLVPMEHGLHGVLPGGEVLDAVPRIAQDARVDGGRLARLQAVDVDAEHELGLRALADLEARLLGGVVRDEEQDPPVEGLPAQLRPEVDAKPQRSGLGRVGHHRQRPAEAQDREREDPARRASRPCLHFAPVLLGSSTGFT